MNSSKTIISLILFTISTHLSFAEDTKKSEPAVEPKMVSPKGAKVYIIFPKDGKTVKKKFPIKFGVKKNGSRSSRNKVSQYRPSPPYNRRCKIRYETTSSNV